MIRPLKSYEVAPNETLPTVKSLYFDPHQGTHPRLSIERAPLIHSQTPPGPQNTAKKSIYGIDQPRAGSTIS